jgi:RNA polymerase sigma-70 factor (ECF subfamily)
MIDVGVELPDEELVRRVLGGERELYGVLVGRYQSVLYRHALGMLGSPDAAADLVQESFIRAVTRLASCQEPARFGGWVFRILRNLCLDQLRARRRHAVPIEEAERHLTALDESDSELIRTETRRALDAALATLPAPQREAFLLKHVEEMSYDEMAEMLGASVSALKMRVMRAREALQSLLAGASDDGL